MLPVMQKAAAMHKKEQDLQEFACFNRNYEAGPWMWTFDNHTAPREDGSDTMDSTAGPYKNSKKNCFNSGAVHLLVNLVDFCQSQLLKIMIFIDGNLWMVHLQSNLFSSTLQCIVCIEERSHDP
jgi:hypothetical protein